MEKHKKCLLLERLLEEGLFENEKEAASWAMERKILVNNVPVTSVKEKVFKESTIRVKEYYKTKYVNKGGLKLEGALEDFHVDATGMVALDCGASTGGFSDCLLAHGASLVYAVDVGFGQLAGKLQNSPNVVNMEQTNLSDEKLLQLTPRPELITLDLSYLSLKKAAPICQEILGTKGSVIALVKPLFEVESSEIRQKGVINDRQIFVDVLMDLCGYFSRDGLELLGLTHSRVRGNNHTIEYFIHLGFGTESRDHINNWYEPYVQTIVDASLQVEKFKKNRM